MLKLIVSNALTGECQEATLTPELTPQGECLVGRALNCDLVLESRDVSRVHSKITVQAGKYCYTDLGSANGSYINNKEVQPHQNDALKTNDLIRIADFIGSLVQI